MQSIPLILTLSLDEDAHAHFTGLRDIYFPKYCNFLEAHLTLFHHLPSEALPIEDIIIRACDRQAISLEVNGLKNIGNGVAFTIASPELQVMHKSMQENLDSYLIPQDRKTLWPHITIQNKVTAFKASQTFSFLNQDFTPFTIKAIGITSYLYLGGPWEKLKDYHFQQENK